MMRPTGVAAYELSAACVSEDLKSLEGGIQIDQQATGLHDTLHVAVHIRPKLLACTLPASAITG